MLGISDEIEELRNENKQLKNRLEDFEQYSRKHNLIISGVPKIKDEEVKEVVKTIATGFFFFFEKTVK